MAFTHLGDLGTNETYVGAFDPWSNQLQVPINIDLEAGDVLVCWSYLSSGDFVNTIDAAGQNFTQRASCEAGYDTAGRFVLGYIHTVTLSAPIAAADGEYVTLSVTRSAEVFACMAVSAFRGVNPALSDYNGQGPTAPLTSSQLSYTYDPRIYNEDRDPVSGAPSGSVMVGPTAPMAYNHELYLAVVPFITYQSLFPVYFSTRTFTPTTGWNLIPVTNSSLEPGGPGNSHGFVAAWKYVETPSATDPELLDFSRNGSSTDGLAHVIGWFSCSADPLVDADDESEAFNFRSRLGWYYRAHVTSTGGVEIKRARGRPNPPFDLTAEVNAGPDARRPTLAEDDRETLFCVWWVDNDPTFTVYYATSDDDGATWSSAVSLFSNAKHPIVRQDPVSKALAAAAYVGGQVHFRIRYPGETNWSAAAALQSGGAAVAVEDEAFGMEWMGDEQSRLIFAVKKSGGTAITEFESFDDGATAAEV